LSATCFESNPITMTFFDETEHLALDSLACALPQSHKIEYKTLVSPRCPSHKRPLTRPCFNVIDRQSKKQNLSFPIIQSPISVYKSKSSLESRSTGRRISFSSEAKGYDGLRMDKTVFEEIVYQFFILQKSFCLTDMIALVPASEQVVIVVPKVRVLLEDLYNRLTLVKEPGVEVPVLPQGGKKALKLTEFHASYVGNLVLVAKQAENYIH